MMQRIWIQQKQDAKASVVLEREMWIELMSWHTVLRFVCNCSCVKKRSSKFTVGY